MALEDKNQKVQIYGLTEKEVFNPKEMQEIVDYANNMRTTHNTVTNETSSRSHLTVFCTQRSATALTRIALIAIRHEKF